MIAVVSGLANRAFGYEFQGAAAFNTLTANTEGVTPVAPWVTLLAAIAANNPVIAAIIALTFLAWIYFWIPAELIYPQRAFLAWSFDRMAPDRNPGPGEFRSHLPESPRWRTRGVPR